MDTAQQLLPSGRGPDMIDEDPVLRVLCADDDHDTADTLVVLLEIAGLKATAYYDGSSVLAAAESTHPEVLILDLAMPGLNGDEVAKRVRAREWGRAVVLVALTGLPGEEARRRTSEAGFDLHLTKPVDPSDLALTIMDLVILRGPHVHTPPRVPWPRGSGGASAGS
jgi:two-component system, OmpR family, response regulator